MSDEQRNLEVVARLGQLWNAGERDAVLSLYHDDVVMTAAPNWIDPGPWIGKEQVEKNQRDWASAWRQIDMSMDRVEAVDDKVVCIGKWISRGAASGIAGTTPIAIVFTLTDGLIKRFEWFEHADEAMRAAGLQS
jgi:ketosteroid isomerase-like protein